jgi:hypothetical protein
MDTIKLWARNGKAVRQAIELGELVHLDTASEELTDEFLLFAIQSGLLSKWAGAFPDPRCTPEISMEVILASHLSLFCHTGTNPVKSCIRAIKRVKPPLRKGILKRLV